MSILSILIAPHPLLKQKAAPVVQVDTAIVQLMDDLLETMYDAPGIGLAANQVGVLKRVIVLDLAREEDEKTPYQMANPEILTRSEETDVYEEGCLSVPDFTADITRPAFVKIRYLDRNNTLQELEAEGLLATCVQHEIDHLNGELFIDYLSPLKRMMILKKLKKEKRHSSTAQIM